MLLKDYKSLNLYSFILILSLFVALLLSCKSNCPDNVESFKSKMKMLTIKVSDTKRLKTDYEWDLIDKKIRNTVFECYPKFSGQLSQSEEIYFWENMLGYVFVRYGADLLKKYSKTDRLLLMIKDNLKSKKVALKPAVKRLCKEWPVLIGSSVETIDNLVKDIFEPEKEKLLIDSLIN